MAYTHVLLDLDHTLLDSEASLRLAFDDAMAIAGLVADGMYPTFDEINRRLWRQVETGELTPPQVHIARFEILLDALDADADAGAMAGAFARGLGAHGELYNGARAVLDELAGVASLSLVTNGLSEVQRARIERLDIARYFDAVVISAEVGTAKPSPAIFAVVFEQLSNPDKATTIMVGDNLGSDIAGGNNVAISTCWYNPHGAPGHAEHPATYEIEALDRLPPIVQGRGRDR